MTTLTVTSVVHYRPRRLSLIASQPQLFRLPLELALDIFEAAIVQCDPGNLALVSKAFRKVVDIILYRTVVLDSQKTVHLFHRTVLSKTRAFLADHVKRLVLSWVPDSKVSCTHIHDILASCSGVRALVSPTCIWPINSLPATNGLNTIVVQSFDGENTIHSHHHQTQGASNTLTHLRFCEPSDVWFSPLAALETFGPLPSLSHLQVARRANANEANDIVFAQDICQILHTFPSLKMLIISIFPENLSFASIPIEDTDLWRRMSQISEEDRRVVILPGQSEEWKEGWENAKLLRSGRYPADFWIRVTDSRMAG